MCYCFNHLTMEITASAEAKRASAMSRFAHMIIAAFQTPVDGNSAR
jgi:hypothetical protein